MKTTRLLTAILILMISASFANAEVSSQQETKVEQGQQNSLITGDYYGSTETPQPTKLDSNVTVPLTPFVDSEGWMYWTPDNKKTLSVKEIEIMRNSSYGLERDAKFWQTHKNQSEEILILRRRVIGYDDVSEMGYAKVIANKPYFLKSLICEALHLAMKEGKINHAVVRFRGKFITVGKVRSLGGFAGGGAPIGSETDPGKIVVSAAIGSGFGSSMAWVDKGFEVEVISYDHIPPEYFASLAAMDNAGAVAKPEKTAKTAPVNFDTDEHAVNDRLTEYPEKQNQTQSVNDIAAGIYRDWPAMTANGTIIYFMGGADPRGTDKYNAYLGLQRSRDVALTIAKILVEKYGLNAEDVVKTIKYASTGENNPISNEYKKNRVVYMVRGEIISILN